MTQTPEEKGKELVEKFKRIITRGAYFSASTKKMQCKQAAIICVQREIDSYKWFYSMHYSRTIDFDITHAFSNHIKELEATKQAIEQL